jgi:NifB/MoaA-like Fe-S oxidoreductase
MSEAAAVVDLVEEWQELFTRALGRRLVYAADEYYLLSDRPFPVSAAYDGFPQHENGIGMGRAFAEEFEGAVGQATTARPGFFSWVDGAPASGYRARRVPITTNGAGTGPDGAPTGPSRTGGDTTVITGEYGARILEPLLGDYEGLAKGTVRLLPVHNSFFGGNIAVTGLLTGSDVSRALEHEPPDRRCLLPDVCLSEGRFLDGRTLADLPRPVQVVPTDGRSLRQALDAGCSGNDRE